MTRPAPSTTDHRPTTDRLLLPDGWFRILLDPGQRDPSVDALVRNAAPRASTTPRTSHPGSP